MYFNREIQPAGKQHKSANHCNIHNFDNKSKEGQCCFTTVLSDRCRANATCLAVLTYKVLNELWLLRRLPHPAMTFLWVISLENLGQETPALLFLAWQLKTRSFKLVFPSLFKIKNKKGWSDKHLGILILIHVCIVVLLLYHWLLFFSGTISVLITACFLITFCIEPCHTRTRLSGKNLFVRTNAHLADMQKTSTF